MFKTNDEKQEKGRIAVCWSYRQYFNRSYDINIYSLMEPQTPFNDILANSILKCLNESHMVFLLKKIEVVPQAIPLLHETEEFIFTSETAKIKTEHETWSIRKTVSQPSKAVIIMAESLEQIYVYFKTQSPPCWRCLHLLTFFQEDVKENNVYRTLNDIWEDWNILNVVLHSLKSGTSGYFYMFNPFYLRYVKVVTPFVLVLVFITET